MQSHSCVFGVRDFAVLARQPHLLAHKVHTLFSSGKKWDKVRLEDEGELQRF